MYFRSSGLWEVYAARYDGGAWNPAGAGAMSGGGVSNTGGEATLPKLAAGGAES